MFATLAGARPLDETQGWLPPLRRVDRDRSGWYLTLWEWQGIARLQRQISRCGRSP